MPRIDTHHHYFPPDLKKEVLNDNLGWHMPEGNLPWTPEVSLRAMDAAGIDIAILSFPALHLGSVSEENRKIARGRNIYISDIVKKHPNRFGFFATLPFLDDTEGALKEIAYAYDELHADGIGLSTSYGVGPDGTYIGHEKYEPIWAELDRRKAVVFLHGAQVEPASPPPDPTLVVPIADVPNETYKAAAHLVVTGRKRRYPNVKIILSHLGGSTLALAPRVAIGANYLGCPLTPEEILDDFKTFYYDTALSGYDSTLRSADAFVPREQLLFGSDFPAVSMEMSDWYKHNVEKHYEGDQSRLQGIMYKNALKLFPRLRELIRD